jgi:urease accessory protein
MERYVRASSVTRLIFFILVSSIVPSLAYAHVGVGQTSGFAYGLAHPVTGLDHIAAMVAVGLWTAQRGGRAVWVVPLSFVSVMAAGCLLFSVGVSIPFVETGIMISVLVLGMLVVAAVRLPLLTSSLLVALFAVFHGHAHGAEMPATASGFAYGIGFVLSTGFLHAFGMGLGWLSQRLINQGVIRYAGGAITTIGIYLCIA